MAEDTTQQDINIDMREDIPDVVDNNIYKSEFTVEEDIAFLKRQLKNISTSSKYYSAVTTQNANGTVAITGVGFQPSRIRIHAWYQQDGKAGESIGIADSTSNVITYYRKFDGTNYTQDAITTQIIYTADNNGTTALQATLDSFDADGFTMTFSQYIGSGSIKYIYECY